MLPSRQHCTKGKSCHLADPQRISIDRHWLGRSRSTVLPVPPARRWRGRGSTLRTTIRWRSLTTEACYVGIPTPLGSQWIWSTVFFGKIVRLRSVPGRAHLALGSSVPRRSGFDRGSFHRIRSSLRSIQGCKDAGCSRCQTCVRAGSSSEGRFLWCRSWSVPVVKGFLCPSFHLTPACSVQHAIVRVHS